MGKKGRRQGDPRGDKEDASDSSEDNKTGEYDTLFRLHSH